MNNSTKKLIFILFLLINSMLFAQDKAKWTETIWDNYTNNKFDKALEQTNQYLSQYPNDLDMILMQIDLQMETFNYNEATKSFVKFIELSDNPSPIIDYYIGVWIQKSRNAKEMKDQTKLLERILLLEKLDDRAKGTLIIELARRYDLIKDIDNAATTYKKTKSINNWSLLGPFSNIVGSGFDKEAIVLSHPENYTFTAKFNAKLTWFDCTHSYDGDWVYLDRYNAGKNSIVFAQTFIKSETEKEYIMNIGFSGSLKVFVNDRLVLKEQKEINNGTDAYSTKIKLNAGYNRLLIQVGQSDNRSSNFLVRLKDLNNKLVDNIVSTSKVQAYTKDNGTPTFGSQSLEYHKYMQNYYQTATQLKDFKRHLYLKYIIQSENFGTVLDSATDLSNKYPKSRKLMETIAEYYSRTGNSTMQTEIYKKIQMLDTNSYAYFQYLLSQSYEKEEYSNCLSLINQYKSVQSEETYFANLLEIYGKEKQIEEVIKTAEKAYEKYPYNKNFITLKSIIETQVSSNVNKGLKVISKITDDIIDFELFKLYCSTLLQAKRDAEVFSYIKDEEKYFYDNSSFFMYVAEIYQGKQINDKAEVYYNKVLEFCPYYSIINEKKGMLFETVNKPKAREYFANSLNSYPYDYDLLRKLRDLDDKPSIFNLFEEQNYYNLFKEFKDNTDDNNNLNNILDEENVVVYASGASERKQVILTKILTEKGIDIVKEFQVGQYNNEQINIEKAEVLKPNGSKNNAEINGTHIVFPNLKIGDGILIIYKVKYYSVPGLDNQFFFSKIFQDMNWSQKTTLNLLIDTSYKFNFVNTGNKIDLKTSNIENFKKYTWEKNNIPKFSSETNLPNVYEITDVINISSISSWSEINKWYTNLSNTNTDEEFLADKKITEIFPNGYDKISEMDRAKAIYKYIVGDIRYSSVGFRNSGLIPQKPSEVISTNLGDCKDVSLLFKVLCNKVKLDVNLILVSTKDYGLKQLSIPNINFNHCMALLRIADKKYFIELTNDLNGFGTISPFSLGAAYFEIGSKSNETLSFIEPDTRPKNLIKKTVNISFEENKMIVTKDYSLKGNEAAETRASLKNEAKKDQDEYFYGYLPSIYPNKELNNYNIGELKDLISDSLTYNLKYTVDGVFTSIGNLQIFRIPYSQLKEGLNFLSIAKRTYPFCIWNSMFNYDSDVEEVELNFPAGKMLAQVPTDVVIENDIFSYKLKYSNEKNKCKIVRITNVKKLEISPELYPSFISSIKQMIEAEKVQLAFTDYVPEAPAKKKKK